MRTRGGLREEGGLKRGLKGGLKEGLKGGLKGGLKVGLKGLKGEGGYGGLQNRHIKIARNANAVGKRRQFSIRSSQSHHLGHSARRQIGQDRGECCALKAV